MKPEAAAYLAADRSGIETLASASRVRERSFTAIAEWSTLANMNTIANYSPDIVPFLHAPPGSAFAPDETGKLGPVPYEGATGVVGPTTCRTGDAPLLATHARRLAEKT